MQEASGDVSKKLKVVFKLPVGQGRDLETQSLSGCSTDSTSIADSYDSQQAGQ